MERSSFPPGCGAETSLLKDSGRKKEGGVREGEAAVAAAESQLQGDDKY